jgi:hypothetical protein
MNIPARYVNGYLGHIGVSRNAAPMDFNTWSAANRSLSMTRLSQGGSLSLDLPSGNARLPPVVPGLGHASAQKEQSPSRFDCSECRVSGLMRLLENLCALSGTTISAQTFFYSSV